MDNRHSQHMIFMAILLMSGSVWCDDGVDGGEDTADASSIYAKRQSMWFGPRLGRNKRTQYDITMTSSGSAAAATADNILDILRDSNWALIPITSGEGSPPAWVSRLGRTEDDEEAMEASRSPPFAPRLGRRRHLVTQFAPRLGRTYSGNSNTLQPASQH